MWKQLVCLCACAAIATFPALRADADAGPAFGVNLLSNGDAEENFGASDATKIVKPTNWQTTGSFSVVAYGAKGEFPDIATPGTANRGMNFFDGGDAAVSTASQDVALDWCRADVDSGGVTYKLSGWLGGWGQLKDAAEVDVAFKDASGKVLAQDKIGPVDPARRLFNTVFVEDDVSGSVPKGAATATVTIVLRRDGASGSNHAFADNVSLELTKASS